MTTATTTATMTDYRLRCRDCEAAFSEMYELLKHRDRVHDPRPPRRRVRRRQEKDGA